MCGRSRPLADDPAVDLCANTTDHLIADMERLRAHLGIERWLPRGHVMGFTLPFVRSWRIGGGHWR